MGVLFSCPVDDYDALEESAAAAAAASSESNSGGGKPEARGGGGEAAEGVQELPDAAAARGLRRAGGAELVEAPRLRPPQAELRLLLRHREAGDGRLQMVQSKNPSCQGNNTAFSFSFSFSFFTTCSLCL
uniref:Uncharacterized protein n=1 Tax=Oryza barthii TaxID=65489 RepID=A0A0D3FJ18_9ORYZ